MDKPERRLTSNNETKDDLKEDYEVKKKVCSELNECLKKQTEQVGELYATLQESAEPVSPTLYDTLCLSDGQSGDAGIVLVADTTRFDQVSFCQKSLSAECEFRKKEAELEGKRLFIELKEVVNCDSLDELQCLNDYSFDKRELTFVKANFFPILDKDVAGPSEFSCDNLPSKFSDESEYLGTPLLAYDPTEVFDYCDLWWSWWAARSKTNVKLRVANSERLSLGQVEINLHVGEEYMYPTSS